MKVNLQIAGQTLVANAENVLQMLLTPLHIIVGTAVRKWKVGEVNEKISMGLAFSVNYHCRFYLGNTFNCKIDMGNKSAGMVKSVTNSQLRKVSEVIWRSKRKSA